MSVIHSSRLVADIIAMINLQGPEELPLTTDTVERPGQYDGRR